MTPFRRGVLGILMGLAAGAIYDIYNYNKN